MASDVGSLFPVPDESELPERLRGLFGLDERRQAICAYAEKLTLDPQELGEADLQELRAAGLTLEEAWDVAEIAAMYNFTNRMAMATNMLPNAEYAAIARA
jgi:uncharacterized peroxidase-related enzyme